MKWDIGAVRCTSVTLSRLVQARGCLSNKDRRLGILHRSQNAVHAWMGAVAPTSNLAGIQLFRHKAIACDVLQSWLERAVLEAGSLRHVTLGSAAML